MTRKLLGLVSFIATGAGLLILSALESGKLFHTLSIIIIGICFSVGIFGHYKELMK